MSKKEKGKTVIRWALKAVSMDDNIELQKALDEGYEPWAVMTRFMPASKLDPTAKGGVIPINLMYFKIKYEVPLDENGKEKAITLIKKQNAAPSTPA